MFIQLVLPFSNWAQPQNENLKVRALASISQCLNMYAELESFEIDIKYGVYYDSTNFDKPADTEVGKVIKSGGNYYRQEMDNLILLNKDYQFYIREKSKTMLVQKRIDDAQDLFTFSADSLVSTVKEIPGGYHLTLKSGQLSAMDIIFDADGGLKKLRSYYRDKMDFGEGMSDVITEVEYVKFLKDPKIEKQIFSSERIVKIQGSHVEGVGKYASYKIINQL